MTAISLGRAGAMTDHQDDLIDFDPDGIHAVQLEEREVFERGQDNLVDISVRNLPRALPDISEASAIKWLGKQPEPLAFAIADFVPQGMTTLLVGDGGAGKTLLMQTAITCVVNDIPWLGKAPTPGTAAGVFAEDIEAVLHNRHHRIKEAFGLTDEQVAGAYIQSYAGLDARLWHETGPTPFLAELERQLATIPELRFVALDNAALLFSGNENDRLMVTSFINGLNGMAQRLGVGIMLSTHTSKSSTASATHAASGSTAWIFASRSVLKLWPENDEEPPRIELIKANHAKPGEVVKLKWECGILTRAPVPGSFEAKARARRLDNLIFDKVQEAWDRDNPLSTVTNQGHRYLPRAVSRASDFSTAEAQRVMVQMLDGGVLAEERKNARTPRGLKVIRRPTQKYPSNSMTYQ